MYPSSCQLTSCELLDNFDFYKNWLWSQQMLIKVWQLVVQSVFWQDFALCHLPYACKSWGSDIHAHRVPSLGVLAVTILNASPPYQCSCPATFKITQKTRKDGAPSGVGTGVCCNEWHHKRAADDHYKGQIQSQHPRDTWWVKRDRKARCLPKRLWQKESNSSGCPSLNPGLTALRTLDLYFNFECSALFKVIFDLKVPEGISARQELEGSTQGYYQMRGMKVHEADLFLWNVRIQVWVS